MRKLLLASLLLLSACGFHLRGAVELPPALSVMQVQDATPATDIAPELRRALQRQGVTLVEDAGHAAPVLQIRSESVDKHVQVVDVTGKVQQYSVRHIVQFSLRGGDGSEWLPLQQIRASRELRFEEAAVLGTGNEEQQLVREMRSDAVARILRLLQSLKLDKPQS